MEKGKRRTCPHVILLNFCFMWLPLSPNKPSIMERLWCFLSSTDILKLIHLHRDTHTYLSLSEVSQWEAAAIWPELQANLTKLDKREYKRWQNTEMERWEMKRLIGDRGETEKEEAQLRRVV